MYTIFKGVTGSRLYGTHTEKSDTDIRGVFIPAKEYFFSFLHHIEQIENKVDDIVLFDIRKFFALCADCNPNIVELLFVPDSQTYVHTKEWYSILSNRNLFLSQKARYTFAGYATSQLHRIKQHRSWLLNPPKKQPERSDFGLPNDRALLNGGQTKAITELIEAKQPVAEELFDIFNREKAFQNANAAWGKYQEWKKNRNPNRAVLEEKFGYDCKFAMHLIRLISEGEELLLTGNITFPRPDKDHLLDVRNGKYTYEQLIEMVGDLDQKFDEIRSRSVLPNKPDRKKLDSLCVKLVENRLDLWSSTTPDW